MSRRRIVTTDERRLWLTAMRGTEPMSGRSLPEPPPPPVTGDSSPAAESLSLPPAAAGPANATGKGGKAAKGWVEPPIPARDLDRRTAQRFRQGRMSFDRRLDLHGKTQAEAHTVLAAMVHRAWMEGLRCLLVITGKGRSTSGVLRQMVPRWLAEPGLARMILAVETAQLKDGGDGALYVLVRRRRPANPAGPLPGLGGVS